MKKLWLTFLLSAAMLVSIVEFSSCRKDTSNIPEGTSITDNASAEMHYDLMYNQVDDASVSSNLSSRARKYTITVDSTAMPRTMTLDWGDSNILCDDGVYRRGQIIVTWTGRYRTDGTVITITPSNFYQNDYQIKGSKVVTNNGRNTSGHLSWKIVVNGEIVAPTGETYKWSSDRTRTWVAGEATKLIRLDDKYEITGTYTGVNRKGVAFTATITKPLEIDLGCSFHLVAGTLEMIHTNEPNKKITIDYGNGACDNVGTFTVNGVTRSFIKKH